MVSDAVSSSHGRQEYGTAALAPEELRRAYREVAGRREAGARRRGATPPGMRGSPPHGCALGAGPVHGCAQERRPPSRHRRRDCNRGWVSHRDRKSTCLNSSHTVISYAVFCLKKKKKKN